MSNKEPWLSVNLSSLFPGIGQIYSGKKTRGYLLIFLYTALSIIGIWQILSTNGNFLIGAALLLFIPIIWFWNLFDAHTQAKKNNTSEFEELRKQNKDPWLGMFISQIFFGFGNFYIGKWFAGILAIVVVIFVSMISPFIGTIAIAIFSFVTYKLAPVRRENSDKLAIVVSVMIAVSGFLYDSLGFITRGFETRWIPSGNMEPTLSGSPNQSEADRVLINKLIYNFENPQRGDIIVFSPTTSLREQGYKDAFIKRIVGLPGERFELKEGKVYINDKLLDESKYVAKEGKTVIDVCLSGVEKPLLSEAIIIPADSYIVLGDNRQSSYDSRCWGFLPRKNIIGKVYKRFFPFDRVGSLE